MTFFQILQILREGSRKLLQQAIEIEVQEQLELRKDHKDERGRRTVKRNGSLPQRQFQTGLGAVRI